MSLFSISNDLQRIYNSIEENDGEITEELDEALRISENEFKDKVRDYVNLIANLSSDVEQCSVEIKRIQALKKIKENTVARLKKTIAEAIESFGDRTPKGTAYIDFGTMKVSTRSSKSTEVDDEYIRSIGANIAKYMLNLSENQMLLGSSPYRDREFIEDNMLTDYDLYPLNVSITLETDALSLVRGVLDEKVKKLFDSEIGDKVSLNVSVDKTAAKKMIENGDALSIAKLNNNKTITIK